MIRELVVHVGATKTGSSSFQVGVRRSLDTLAAAGVGVPLPERADTRRHLLRPLGWTAGEGFPRPLSGRRLDRTAQVVASCPGDRLLVTLEELAEIDESRIDALVSRLEASAGLRTSVVVTMRPWTRQLPSDWQEQLKRRLTTPYEDYLGQVRDGVGPEGSGFRQRQDVLGIARRWASRVPAERIHVVPVGGPGQDADALFRGLARVVGVEEHVVTRPARAVNASYGLVECEVLRRLNASLGDRLPDFAAQYKPGVRRMTAHGVLARGRPPRVTLPPAHLGWVQDEMRRQVAGLREAGVREVHDLDLLVPGDDAAEPIPPLDQAELARAAIDALAAFAVAAHEERDRPVGGRPAGHPGRRASWSSMKRGRAQ